MSSSRRTSRAATLDALADRVLEAPDLPDLSLLLTRDLPQALGLHQASLLLWDRKLETFNALLPGDGWAHPVKPGDRVPTPEARFLLADGVLMETPGTGDGLLLPLMARSGLVGMLVLSAPIRAARAGSKSRRSGPGGSRRFAAAPPDPRRRRKAPVSAADVPPLSALATRTALAIENHLYQAELIASERMAALGTMAGMLAHDFRGPMTVIRGYAELLGDNTPAEEVRARAALIVQAVDRLERMTAETLDFARDGGRLVRRNVVLQRFLEDVAADVERQFPGLQVGRSFVVPDVTASLDVDKLLRAVGNVAANALDAMGGRGVFHMEAQLVDGQAGLRLALTLADEGPGVPPEIRERLFDPFVTRGKKGGTGLGLAVARRFIEDHGGRIELLEGGRGARFQIVLPLQDPAVSV